MKGSKAHQPKGGMCAACKHKNKDCSDLPFSEMKPIEKCSEAIIVKCTEFKK